MPSPSITVVGSINMDLVASTDRLPSPGETVLGSSFRTVPGGKGSNQAIAAARAGGNVSFVGAVGSDAFADPLVATLVDAGVRTDRVRRVEGASGIASISVAADGENTIIVIPGANGLLTGFTDADADAITRAQMLVLQLEIPMASVVLAAGTAHRADVPVLLNPSPAQELPTDFAQAVTILVVNEGEAVALGAATLDAVPHVVTTLGARGARYRGPDDLRIEVPAPQVRAVDTTGAGDAFTGALAVAWAEGVGPVAALQRACAAGALATTVPGASSSSPTRTAIDAMVRSTY